MPEMWTFAPRISSFDIQRFHVEFLAAPDASAGAAAIRADDLPLRRVILRGAAHALQLGRHMPEVQRGSLSDGAFADLIPIELHGIVVVARDLAHYDVHVGDALCILLTG